MEFSMISVPVARPMQQGKTISLSRKTISSLPFVLVETTDQQNQEPHLYQGGSIPSRSFKVLQAMTQPENAGEFKNTSIYADQ
jgi:hypothetical protein